MPIDMKARPVYASGAVALFLSAIFFGLSLSQPQAALSQSSGVPILGYAWSDMIGWIDLNCQNTNSCATRNFGLSVANDGTVSGQAWSDSIGWVSADTAHLAGCPVAPCVANLSSTAFTGWLRSLLGNAPQSGGWDGFISLSGAGYGVTNNSVGQFGGYAWGEQNAGWIDFSRAYSVFGTCTPSTAYTCSGPQIIVHTETYASCQSTVTNTSCTAPQFCSVGSPVCLWPQPDDVPGPGGLTGRLTARPNLVPKNATTTVYWNVANVTDCTVTATDGTSWTGATSATSSCPMRFSTGCQSSPITKQTVYTLSCTAFDSSNHKETATVNLLPDFQEW